MAMPLHKRLKSDDDTGAAAEWTPRIWFRLVDPRGQPYRGTSSATSVVRPRNPHPPMIVDGFRDAVKANWYAEDDLKGISAPKLEVFVDQEKLAAKQPLRAGATIVNKHGKAEDDPLLVVVPAAMKRNAAGEIVERFLNAMWAAGSALFGVSNESQRITSSETQVLPGRFSDPNKDPWKERAVLLGRSSSPGDSEGILFGSSKTVSRDRTVDRIIERLRAKNVLLIKSPPMTGKTSMATLVAHRLLHHPVDNKALIINWNLTEHKGSIEHESSNDEWIFAEAFSGTISYHSNFELHWANLYDMAKHRVIYIILDEVQLIYQAPGVDGRPSSPNHKSTCIWDMIKSLMSDGKSRIKILLFAAYGSSTHNYTISTPVKFESGKTMFGIDQLNFTDNELEAYVLKNLETICILQNEASYGPGKENATTVFCRNLKHITGAHVGLCYAAINHINDRMKSGLKYSSALVDDIISLLFSQSLFRQLSDTRAMLSVRALPDDQQEFLWNFLCCKPFVRRDDAIQKTITALLQAGILVETDDSEGTLRFASPTTERCFLDKIIGKAQFRAEMNPESLPALIHRILMAIDYTHLAQSLGRTKKTNILLERAWQMEFYKAAVRCTAETMFVSADVGNSFDAQGAIDFTIHSTDPPTFWGVELLREADRIAGHVSRFKPGGRYANLCRRFTDWCRLDFRRQDMAPDMDAEPEDVFVVCYNDLFTECVLYSKADPNGVHCILQSMTTNAASGSSPAVYPHAPATL